MHNFQNILQGVTEPALQVLLLSGRMGAFSAESPKFFIGMPRRHGTPHLGPNSESPQESPFATYLALLHNRVLQPE